MNSNQLRIQLNSSDVEISDQLEQVLGQPVDVVSGRGLSGEVATWIVISTLVATALPSIVPFVRDLILANRV